MNAPERSPSLPVTLTVLGVSMMTIMANATISPSLPGLSEAFSSTANIETLSGMVLSLPSLAVVLSTSLFGYVADHVRTPALLAATLVLYSVGGTSGFWAQTMPQLLIGRFFLGVGVAGIMTLATMLAGNLWAGNSRDSFMGQLGAAISLGGVIFLLLGGGLAAFGWRWPFLIYLTALPLAVAAAVVIPDVTKRQPTSQTTNSEKLPLGAVAEIASIAFFAMVVFYIIPTRLPFLMQERGFNAPFLVGAAIAALTAASIPASLGYRNLRETFGPLMIFALSFSVLGSGLFLIAVTTTIIPVFIGTTLMGLGLGLVMPNQNSWMMSRVPSSARGRAAGYLTTAVFAGQFVSPLIAGLLSVIMSTSSVFAVYALTLFCMSVILGILQVTRNIPQ